MEKINITLGIPVYNSSKFLPDLFDSLKKQIVVPNEIIFIDDCSNDNSLDLVNSFSNEYKKTIVKVFKNSKNIGIAGNYNRLIKESTSKWVQILDADDYLMDNYYLYINELITKPYFCIITSMKTNIPFVNYLSCIGKTLVPQSIPPWLPILGTVATRSSIIYKKEILKKIKFEDPVYECSDIIHLLKIRLNGKCFYFKKAWIFYRIHENSYSGKDVVEFYEKIKEFPGYIRIIYHIDIFIRKKLFGSIR